MQTLDGNAEALVRSTKILIIDDEHYTRKVFRTQLTRIMHHAERFCRSGRQSCAGDPSVWIGVRQLAVQRVWD